MRYLMQVVLTTLILFSISVVAETEAPKPGLVCPAEAHRVIDGDTTEVYVKLLVDVRLLDCWAPEKREPDGEASKKHLESLIIGKPLLLEIPFNGHDELSDILTFGRVLGRLYVDGRDVGQEMIEAGHAVRDKGR